MSENIKIFDRAVLFYADKLYKEFPVCINLNLYEDKEEETFLDIRVNKTKLLFILSETLFWLQENNFLTFEKPDKRSLVNNIEPQCNFLCVRLTAKGVTILKTPPSSLTKESLGEVIGEKLQTAIKEKLYSKIGDTVTDLTIKLASNVF